MKKYHPKMLWMEKAYGDAAADVYHYMEENVNDGVKM